MELSKQVTSQQISKKISDLGFCKESIGYWFNGSRPVKYELFMDGQFQESECIRAYTASELMEEIIVDKYDVIYITKNDQTKIHIEYSNYSREDVFPYHIESETLADALGLMLIYLLENNLLDNTKD